MARKVTTIAVAALLVALSAGLVVERGRDTREASRLMALLAADLRAQGERTWPRPPLGGEGIEGYAFPEYRAALLLVPGYDADAARAVEEHYASGAALPEWAREFAAVTTPAVDRLARGTRTFAAGRRPDPGQELPMRAINGLALAAEADAILALEEGDGERAADRGMALARFGSDLLRGGSAAEQHAGLRLMERGFRFLESLAAKNALTPGARERLATFIGSEMGRPRGPEELLAGVSLDWQQACARALDGEASDLATEGSAAPATGREILAFWRELRDAMERARAGLAAGRPPGLVLSRAFSPPPDGGHRLYADCAAEILRSLRAVLAAEESLRLRMERLRALIAG